jgi:prepilin-type N-terminal cleavage/methylation domain-containing protein
MDVGQRPPNVSVGGRIEQRDMRVSKPKLNIEKRLTAENAESAEKKLKLRNSATSADSAVKNIERMRRRGFTLTEVLLVVVIIALVGGVGGGIYVGTHKRMQVEKAARDFLLTAQYARIMAIEQQSRYTMQLDATNNRFWLATAQWDEETGQTRQVIMQDYYCRPVELTGDVKFERVLISPVGLETAETDEADAIVFLPNGTASSAVIQIGDGKTHYAISVDAATAKATMYFGMAEEIKMSSVDLDAE